MNTILTQFLEQISSGENHRKHNLELAPLILNKEESIRQYLLLDEAMEQSCLQIGEANEQGMVNNLIVVNLGKKPVLILDGEELVGAKQNRMVNATLLIPAEGKLEIPVSCVERGRWTYQSKNFGRSDAYGYSELRRKKAARVAENLCASASFDADQREVWGEIDRKQAKMKASSKTDAMHDVYRQYENELDDFVNGLHPIDGQVGLAVFINGEFNCLDIFSHPDVLKKLWTKLIKSYAMEALEKMKSKPNHVKVNVVDSLLTSLKGAEVSQYPSVGLGTDIRLTSKEYLAAGLIFEEQVLHLAAFPKFEQSGDKGSSPLAQPSRRRRNNIH